MTEARLTDHRCALCAVAETSAELPDFEPNSSGVIYLNDEFIALLAPGLAGFQLAPRSHVGVLSTDPGTSAVFLAALRRMVTEMQSTYGWSGTSIKPTTHLPGASGHVCYQVVHTVSEQAIPPSSIDLRAQARLLADALGDQVVRD